LIWRLKLESDAISELDVDQPGLVRASKMTLVMPLPRTSCWINCDIASKSLYRTSSASNSCCSARRRSWRQRIMKK
jgi:hypothetical protein